MNSRRVKQGLLAVAVTLVLILAVLKPLPPPKTRAQRIHAVNHVDNISITFQITNTPLLPAASKK